MTLTLRNYKEATKNVDFSKLPKAAQEAHKEFDSFAAFYNEDKDIKEMLDEHIKIVKPYLTQKTKNKSASSIKTTSNPKNTKAVNTSNKRSKAKRTVTRKPIEVDIIPMEIKIIKRYLNFHKKRVTERQVSLLYKVIQKAATEKTIRKTSKYASEIKSIGNDLIATYKQMEGACKFEIPESQYNKLKKIVDDYGITPAVSLIKRFINLYGSITKTKAQRLLTTITNSLKNGKVKQSDKEFEQIKKVEKHLKDYLESDKLLITPVQLNGLQGVAGIGSTKISRTSTSSKSTPRGRVSRPKQKNRNASNQIILATDLAKMKFKTISLRGKFGKLLGKLYDPFYIMFYGPRFHGKSSAALLFANDLVRQHNYKVLYVANEEGAKGTMQEKVIRLGINNPIAIVEEYNPKMFKGYDVVFIDSTQTSDISHKEFKDLKESFPKTSFVIINQANRDGSSKGGTKWEHIVDAIIRIENKTAATEKNRFPGGSINPIKIF